MTTELGAYSTNDNSSQSDRDGITRDNFDKKSYLNTSMIPAVLIKRIAYLSGTPELPEYEGWAPQGTVDSDAKWNIKKTTYSGNLPIEENWSLNIAWDNRTSETYN